MASEAAGHLSRLGGALLGPLSCLLLGLIVGAVLVLGLDSRPWLGLAMVPLLIVLPALAMRPIAGLWLGLLAILVIEEFPSGLGETAERSTRTAFYGTSLGLPGFYATDLILLGGIAWYLLLVLLQRRRVAMPVDAISLGLLAMLGMAVLSVVASFLAGDPLAHGVIQENAGTGFEVNERAARLIAFFQYKNYACLFLAYLLGVMHLRDEQDVQALLRTVGIAALIASLIGIFRLLRHPEWVAQTIPVFYDSPSVWLFAIVIFFSVSAWAYGLLSSRQTVMLFALSALMAVFVLVSFRRTMWGGILLCMPMLLVLIPGRARVRVVVVGGLLACLVGGVLLMSPVGGALFSSVAERVGQTNVSDASTLYRLAILSYVVKHFSDIPLFGFGAQPLWNEFTTLGYFRTNIENVHSLYYWLLLRTGLVGLGVALAAIGAILWSAWRVATRAVAREHRVLGTVILLAIVLFLFSGIFNPVYAETRYTIVLGFGLALLSRLIQFDAMRRSSEQSPDAAHA